MRRIVIFGTKAFAEIAHYYFTHDGHDPVVAFTVDSDYLEAPSFRGLPVVPFDEVERRFPPDDHEIFVAVGIRKVNQQRAAKVAEVEAKGYRLASFVSSKADVARDLDLRPNTIIMERATVMPFVEIGRDTVIWPGTTIGFHGRIGEHCWIVAATFGESVTLGDYTFVGLNATIAPSLSIGRSNIIGAGALILKNTKDFEVYRGPASAPSEAPSTRLWQV